MIFSRSKIGNKTPSALTGLKAAPAYDDNIDDITKQLATVGGRPASGQALQAAAPAANAQVSPTIGAGSKPMFFSANDTQMAAPQPGRVPGRTAAAPTGPANVAAPGVGTVPQEAPLSAADAAADAVSQKRRDLEAAKAKARSQMEDRAKSDKDELARGLDLNGDGFIGGDPMFGQGRNMDENDLIKQAIYDMLNPVDNTGARSAVENQLASQNAENIQSVRARTGLGGMGLTGAAGAAEGTERRRGARESVLTMDEFDRNARNENFQRALAGMGSAREQEAFLRAIAALDEENASEIDSGKQRTDFPAGPEGDAQYNEYLTKGNNDRTTNIEAMPQAEFESLTQEELRDLGWTVSDEVKSDAKGDYMVWTSPNGKKRKAYFDDIGEHTSYGLEWKGN